ncbi:HNH endonuclease [Planococcus koreensis]|uniref:HNH endonuclease n=1 Tax=Planococcus koreensis TaxID=112331 RepID=UPI0039FC7FB6
MEFKKEDISIINLKPGEIFNNTELTDIFKCSPQGGMRRSHKTNSLVLVSDVTKMYEDREEENILYYTGMGRIGDQTLTRQNKTLFESDLNGVEVYYFEVVTPKEYTFRGKVELLREPWEEEQLDMENNLRSVWIFPLKLINL